MIFYDNFKWNSFQNYLLKIKKKTFQIRFKLSQTNYQFISFAYFEAFFLKMPALKKFSPSTFLLLGKYCPLPYTKVSCDLPTVITEKSGVALTQLSLTLHNSRRIFYYQFYTHVKSFFLSFIVDELPAFIVIVYIFWT